MEAIAGIVYELVRDDNNIWGVAIIDAGGRVVYQTDNWDITGDAGTVMSISEETCSIELQGTRYVIVENTPERVIGTNVTSQGHVIICPAGGLKGKVACYVKPGASPRDAVFNAMTYSAKTGAFL